MSLIPTELGRGLHKSIKDLCPFSIANRNDQNHCAHYVSHMMGYEFSKTCKTFTWADKQNPAMGATLRVDDLFGKSPETGLLSNKPSTLNECLIFVTLASNVSTRAGKLAMGNHPRKHVGILSNSKVWNYSNTHRKVLSDPLASFISKFNVAYQTAGTTVEFYYGKFI
ncbi:MAG: hypothetical protein L0Z73_01485 [Gammaproteobacteria bacterium]|nr:hypothetical protein [Gammaproteobacteria bacterium]